jgi:hypothetical protein
MRTPSLWYHVPQADTSGRVQATRPDAEQGDYAYALHRARRRRPRRNRLYWLAERTIELFERANGEATCFRVVHTTSGDLGGMTTLAAPASIRRLAAMTLMPTI